MDTRRMTTITALKEQAENARKAIEALEAGKPYFMANHGSFSCSEAFHENREDDLAFYREMLANIERTIAMAEAM